MFNKQMFRGTEPRFVVHRGDGHPWSCFPTHLDTAGFIDITSISDEWRQYMDPATGKLHDCAEYYRRSQESLAHDQ